MKRVLRSSMLAAAVALLSLSLPGCFGATDDGENDGGAGDAGASCQSGEVKVCTCADQSAGLRTCLPQGSWGSCACSATCAAGLEATPSRLQFGDLPVGNTSTLSVTFTNLATLDICSVSGIDLAAGTDAAFMLPGGAVTALTLDPGASVRVGVTFSPAGASAASGFLTASFAGGVSTVRLLGQGLDEGASVSPTVHDFGIVAFPCAAGLVPVCVTNDGGVNLVLSSAQTTGSADFSVVGGPQLPATLAPGATACFDLRYLPGELGVDTGTLDFLLAPGGITLSVPLTGEGAASGTATDTFLQTASAKADILWVIDSSCSMPEEQTSLSRQVPKLLGYLAQQGVDYQIAVVSMDATTPPTPGRMEPKDRIRDHIITPKLPDPVQTFSQNVMLGTSGSGTEQAFETARLALSPPLILDLAENGGFIRPDAYLSVIFVSDEPEQSMDTLSTYLAFFQGIHGSSRPDLFIASAVVGPPSTSPIDPGGCNGPGGPAAPGPRFWDLAAQTGGAQQSICAPDWSATMSAIASGFGLVSRFPLSGPADATGTFVVEILDPSGSTSPAMGWSYDVGSNAIDFDAAHIPQPGETVSVTYAAACP